MAIDVTTVVDFFWNGLTDNSLIDTVNNYVEIEMRLKVADDTYISNGWRYQTPVGEYLTQDIIEQIVQGFATKLQAAMADTSSPTFAIKLHKPGTQSRGDLLREQEWYNLNDVLPYTAISVVLRTVYTVATYSQGPIALFDETSGASSASSMDDTSVSNVPNISDTNNAGNTVT